MTVQTGLCGTWSEPKLLVFSHTGSFVFQKEEKEDPKKRGTSPKGSAKSKSSKEGDQEPTLEGEPVLDEKYWPVSCCWVK